jgi:uncharacterized PurR-regulated membrane protein YhhQ (DUF165 family)
VLFAGFAFTFGGPHPGMARPQGCHRGHPGRRGLSWAVTSNRDLAVASAVAFLFSELADFVVYQPLRERRWLLAVFASNAVGLVIDSILFLQIAFGSLDFIEDQIIGKLWTTVFAVVVLLGLRRWVIPRYSRPADEPTVPEIA